MPKRQWIIYGGFVFVLFLAVGFLIHQRFFADTVGSILPSTCNKCPKITIHCNSGDIYAKFQTCEIFQNKQNCDIFGFKEGDVLSNTDFAKRIDCRKGTVPASTNFVEGCCSFSHEYTHLCSGSDDSGDYRIRCNEMIAERYGQNCISQTSDYYCNARTSLFKDKSVCLDYCSRAAYYALAMIYDKCMCGKVSASTGTDKEATAGDCKSCTESCFGSSSALWNLLPSTCKNSGLTMEQIMPAAAIKNTCMALSGSNTSSHGCEYYGGPYDFDYARSYLPNSLSSDCVVNGALPNGDDSQDKLQDYCDSKFDMHAKPDNITIKPIQANQMGQCKSQWEGKYRSGFEAKQYTFTCGGNDSY